MLRFYSVSCVTESFHSCLFFSFGTLPCLIELLFHCRIPAGELLDREVLSLLIGKTEVVL